MNKITVEDWVTALRSGKYEQTEETLYDGVGFCCLGVACDIAGAEWKKIGDVRTGDKIRGSFQALLYDDWGHPIEDSVNGNTIPEAEISADYLNMLLGEEIFTSNDTALLIRHNDGTDDLKKFDFNQIADLIESIASRG